MSKDIKKMLAERAEREAAGDYRIEGGFERGAYKRQPFDDLVDSYWRRIDLAAPYIDEGCPPDQWRPSDKLKITYSVLATGPRPARGAREALQLIDDMLDLARDRFRAGLHPNPYLGPLAGSDAARAAQEGAGE